MTPRGRAGALVAELAVALLLAGVAAVIGGGVLVATERRLRRDASGDRATQAIRDVVHALSTDIEAALPDSFRARGDTALDLYAHVGVSVVCVKSGRVVVLPGATSSTGTPYSFWRQLPEAGDLLVAWDSSGSGRWHSAAVDSVAMVTDGAGCSTASAFRTRADSVARIAVTRLRVTPPLPPRVSAGAPLRIFRAVRWVLYRGSDGAWSLGYRRCPAGVCGTVQPVAGPLSPAADSGLAFGLGEPGVIGIAVRTPGAPGAGATSARVSVPLRGSYVGPP